MEALIELVDASFARHGIECPGDVGTAAPGCPTERSSATPSNSGSGVAEPVSPAELPEHNFGKHQQKICP